MRKAQKQQILDAINSLRQAHEEIKAALKAGKLSVVQNMLCECQEFAAAVGENIEKTEGKGHATVLKLESYCETLFEIYTETSGNDNGGSDGNRVDRTLKMQLDGIESSAKNDIAVRKEIVFLPYKAAMWDSLESAWMAARDEEDCDAYVIPIPYFEKNSDGTLGQMHCEIYEYPDYVPVTDWRKYDMEERRPDAVYIQNPYDDCNLVTCVHPRFFSREIKKYTDMLIYIPYFVGVGDYVDEHFCTTPGVFNADKVIVQSKAVKKRYVDCIRKFEKENNCPGLAGNLDKKILPLGSPKLDRIRRICESGETECPAEWRDKVYGTNGKKKTIILYNTTIDALLKHSDIYMEKLRRVLALFRQEEDIVLLWRPHPLLVSTIKAMRIDLYHEFMEIVKQYKEEGWGIYDESPDIDRAIVLSDAYYGDWSSVVELYKTTKKPIMIQNCEV